MATTARHVRTLTLESIPREGPWEAWLLRLPGFPTPDPPLGKARAFLQGLTKALMTERKLTLDVFLHVTELHVADGAQRITDNGRHWLPMIGLGVWPDREPPTAWTKEQAMELKEGESLPTLMFQVFRITKEPEMRENARDVMLGLGTVIQTLGPDDSETMLEKARQTLTPAIQDQAFKGFPFYIPLFDAPSLGKASARQMEEWSCGVAFFLRESHKDGGIVAASREPLAPVFDKLGCTLDKGPNPAWVLPD